MMTEYRILGPLEVSRDTLPLAVGGRRERTILGILLLHAGEVVSLERLIDGVWGEARPTSAKHMVHECVSQLRRTVGGDSIMTRAPGYVLVPPDEPLDSGRFEALVAEARGAVRDGWDAEALRAYDAALALWRGDVLADLALEGQARLDADRLDQDRLLASEERIDVALALGRHRQLIAELEHAVRQKPLRERPRAQLMLALYRSGRQTDALARYREGRELLVESVGVEPGPELRALERAILQHDPALAPTPATTARAIVRGRRRLAILALALLGVGAIVVALVVATHGGSSRALPRIEGDAVGAIDPHTDRVVRVARVGSGAGRIVAAYGSLWVVDDYANTVSRVDPESGRTVETIQVDDQPTAIAAAAGFVWVACTGAHRVDRIDPRIDRVTQHIPVGYGSSAIARSPGALWVADELDETVTEIDSTTGTRRRTLGAGPTPSDIAFGFGALWVANESSSTISRLDPKTGSRRVIPVGNGPESLLIAYGSVWVANTLDDTVWRIDPATSAIRSVIGVGPGPSSVLAADGAVWVADSNGEELTRINPATDTVAKQIVVGSHPQSLAVNDGEIWASTRPGSTSHRGGTLRALDYGIPDSLDPALAYTPSAWSILTGTSDGLVGFQHVGGLDGGTLVPDLATSLPVPSSGGRTYTFQLRRGLRYSDGEPVRASDFRRGLERLFRLDSPGAFYYRELVGGTTCSKTRCDLSRGVMTDDRAGTVTLHLQSPDPELGYKLALPFADPVPAAVSITRRAPLGVPGTGPYRIASYREQRLVLVRNTHFRVWSDSAQPAGYPDRIEVTYGIAPTKELTAVEQSRADFMQTPLPAARFGEIETRYAAQVHIFPGASTFAMFLNTRLPPFDKLDARRAVEFAVDRRVAVARFDRVAGPFGLGGADGMTATCQILPAGIPGYRPYCPYTRDPTAGGGWTAPDLVRARSLVSESGTRGARVVFDTGPNPLELIVGKLAIATLDELGYRATLHVDRDSADYLPTVSNSRTHAQAGFDNWIADYPAPSSFLERFTCAAFTPASRANQNLSELCDPRVDQAIDKALRAQREANSTARAEWTTADHLVTGLAAWVPLANGRNVVLVSRRVGNVQSNPQWGVLFDQMWVK